MKKLISLILCLLLCFTFIVSCEKEEAPTSSSSSSSSEEVPSSSSSSSSSSSASEEVPSSTTPNEETIESTFPKFIQYYYHVSYDICSNLDAGVRLIQDLNELNAMITSLGISAENAPTEITSEIFANSYVIVVLKHSPGNLIGYRNMVEGKDGCFIEVDYLEKYYDKRLNSDGELMYVEVFPEADQEFDPTIRSCDIIVIPKKRLSFSIDASTNIQTRAVIYPVEE